MDREFLIDLFAGFGPVAIRRMFSGFGISADGINFALALRSGLYLRADEASFGKFEAAGSKPFSYETRARTMTVRSYWQGPAHLFDDSDEFAIWARDALAAAQRAALIKRTRTRASSRSGREHAKATAGGAKAGVSKAATKKGRAGKAPAAAKASGKAPAARPSKPGVRASAGPQKSRTPSSRTR